MHGTGNAEVLQNSLPRDIGSASSQFLCQRRLNQGHPAGYPLDLVSWREHSAVCALDQFASAFASLASSPRPSLLRHYLTILPSKGCYEYIISSRRVTQGRGGVSQ